MSATSSTENKPRSPRWKRWGKRLLLAGASLVTLLFLALAIENYRARLAWNHYIANLESRGERLSIEAYRPPAVPENENFAALPYIQHLQRTGKTHMEARDEFPWNWPRGNWNRAQLTDWTKWQRDLRGIGDSDQPQDRYGLASRSIPEVVQLRETPPGDPLDDLFFLLGTRSSVLNEIREGAARPVARFDFQPESGGLEVLSGLKGLAGAFQASSLGELARGNPDAALDDLRILLRLADASGAEPLLICHLVQVSILGASIQVVWEGLALERWESRHLLEIERSLASINLSADLARTFRGERAFNLAGITFPSDDPGQPQRTGWFSTAFRLRNELNILRMYEELILPPLDPENRRFDLPLITKLEEEAAERFQRKTPYNIFAGMLHPAISKAASKSLRMHTTLELARTASALERRRLLQGTYPDRLSDLVPEHLPALPIDPCDSTPLKYNPVPRQRFILYSVGLTGVDHAGATRDELDPQTRADDPEAGDWVWRYP